jgi:hypothetical protein
MYVPFWMDHQFHMGGPAEGHDPQEPLFHYGLDIKEVIGGDKMTVNPSAQETPVQPIGDPFFSAKKMKRFSNGKTGMDGPVHDHVGAKMHVLVSIYMGRPLPIQPQELLQLRMVDILELPP